MGFDESCFLTPIHIIGLFRRVVLKSNENVKDYRDLGLLKGHRFSLRLKTISSQISSQMR